jgi:hypothetical protein
MSQDIQTDPPLMPTVVEAPALQPVVPSTPMRPQPKLGPKKKPKVPFRKRRS